MATVSPWNKSQTLFSLSAQNSSHEGVCFAASSFGESADGKMGGSREISLLHIEGPSLDTQILVWDASEAP